jgi:hypothetical protein
VFIPHPQRALAVHDRNYSSRTDIYGCCEVIECVFSTKHVGCTWRHQLSTVVRKWTQIRLASKITSIISVDSNWTVQLSYCPVGSQESNSTFKPPLSQRESNASQTTDLSPRNRGWPRGRDTRGTEQRWRTNQAKDVTPSKTARKQATRMRSHHR